MEGRYLENKLMHDIKIFFKISHFFLFIIEISINFIIYVSSYISKGAFGESPVTVL